jgi:hypothetical protein
MTGTTVDNLRPGRRLGATGGTVAATRADPRNLGVDGPGSPRPTGNAATVLGIGS